MSRQTLAAIEDALQAHIAENDGGIITNWVVAIETREHNDNPDVDAWGNEYIAGTGSTNGQRGLTIWLNDVYDDHMRHGTEDDDD